MLTYDLDGAGPVVVLLHSSVCDRRMWEPQLKPLVEAGYSVLRCDFRGHGDSSVAQGEYSNGDDVVELLDSLGIDQFFLVGASFGGYFAQELAARFPARVKALALVCALADQPRTEAIRAFGAREDELLEAGDVDGAVALNVEMFVGPEADAATREFVGVMQKRAFELQLAESDGKANYHEFEVGDIVAPTLVVSGQHDVDFFQQIAEHLAATIPGAKHTVLDWAGHLPSLESPERFNPVLLEFLAAQR